MNMPVTVETSGPGAVNKFNEALAAIRLKRCIAVAAFFAGEGETASELNLRLASTDESVEEHEDRMIIPCKLGSCAVILDMETTGIVPLNCQKFEEGTVL